MLRQSGLEVSEPTPRACIVADRCQASTATWRPSSSGRPMRQARPSSKTTQHRCSLSLTLTLSVSLSLPLSPRQCETKCRRHCPLSSIMLTHHHHHTTVHHVSPIASPPPRPPCRSAITLVRAKVKAYGPLPSPPWPWSAAELRAHRGQPYPPLLLPLSP